MPASPLHQLARRKCITKHGTGSNEDEMEVTGRTATMPPIGQMDLMLSTLGVYTVGRQESSRKFH